MPQTSFKIPFLKMHQKIENRKLCEGNKPLKEVDPEIMDLIKQEQHRQFLGLEMIASEVN